VRQGDYPRIVWGINVGTIEPLLYKEDWPQVSERYRAFWEHDIIDRACIAVTAPRPRQVPMPAPQSTSDEYLMADIDYYLARKEAVYRNTYFGGEALPARTSVVGYAVFGGQPVFDVSADTLWFDPIISDWERTPYHFDPQNKWCQHFLEMKRREYAAGHGKWLTGLDGTLWPTDMLSVLRGAQNLLMDLREHPEEVRAAQGELLRAWKWINGIRFEMVHAKEDGNVSMGLWSPGPYFHLGCDFGCMISPKDYVDFVLPEIAHLAKWMDHSFYHLDGEGAIRHLPTLFDLKELDGIQWTYGAAHDTTPAVHWIPLYQLIQKAGKLVHISCQYDEVEPLLAELDARGIILVTNAPSVEAADTLLENAKRWSRRGIHVVS